MILRGCVTACDHCGAAGPPYDNSNVAACRKGTEDGDCHEVCIDCASEWFDDANEGHQQTCICTRCATAGAAV